MLTIKLPIGIITYPELINWLWVCAVICTGLSLINTGMLMILLSHQSNYRKA